MIRDGSYDSDLRGRIDQIKGILACAIIVRHVDGVLELIPWLMIVLSAFCSYNFFLLGFLSSQPRSFLSQLIYCLKRFYKPFIIFFTFSCILFFVIIDHTSVKGTVARFFISLGIQSAEALKASSGFSLFWFIPCYVLLTLLRSIGSAKNYLLYAILTISLFFHFGGANYLSSIMGAFPFSFHVALYCYPLCLLFYRVKSYLFSNCGIKYLCVAIFLGSCVYFVKCRCALYFSSSLFPAYTNPVGILIHDACALSAIGVLSLTYDFWKSSFFKKVGKFSFEVYLIHQFANYLVIYAAGKIHGYGSILHVCSVVALTMAALWLLQISGAHKFIFSAKYAS